MSTAILIPDEARAEMRRRTAEVIREITKPPPRLTLSQWADQNRVLSPEASAEPGPWRTDRAPYLREIQDTLSDPYVRKMVWVAASQVGKALALDTAIPTRDGWTTMGEIQVDDVVFDERGNPCRITLATPVQHGRRCFCVEFSDGAQIVADGAHRWYTEQPCRGRSGIFTTFEIGENLKSGERHNHAIPTAAPLSLPDAHLPIPPYTLGAWLGDGHSYSGTIYGHEDDLPFILREIGGEGVPHELGRDSASVLRATLMPSRGTKLRCRRGHTKREGRGGTWYCPECNRLRYRGRIGPLPPTMHSLLRESGLLGAKHIPREYQRASVSQRMALLQGLMDTDGTSSKAGLCSLTSVSRELAEDVFELLGGLGFKPTWAERRAKIRGRDCGPAYRLVFVAYRERPVFRLPRKRGRLRTITGGRVGESRRRRIVSVREVESVPVRCIMVDSPSHLYLAGRSFIPTHNTESVLNFVGYRIDQDPGPMLVVQPSLPSAQAWSKDRLAPMLRDCEALRGRVKDPRARDSGNTTLHKRYDGGHVTIVGANSAAGLASRPIRDVLLDEVDRYPPSAGSEGDPASLAIQRTRTFWNRTVFYVSSPGELLTSRIWPEWKASDQRRFYVPCPHCGHQQVLEWKNVKWDTDVVDGEKVHRFDTAAYVCEECGTFIEETHKRSMLARGEWLSESPDGRFPGFHISALYSPWVTWAELAELWIDCQDSTELLQTFVNLQLGEPWEERDTEFEPGDLARRAEAWPADVPAGVGVLIASADVQDDRLEVAIKGYGDREESWLVTHERLYGDPEEDDVWASLEHMLTRAYTHESGRELRVRAAMIDAGFLSKRVYRFVRGKESRGVYAIMGSDSRLKEKLSRSKRMNRDRVKLWTVDTHEFKTIVFRRLRATAASEAPGGAGYMHFCQPTKTGADASYFEQFGGEVEKLERKGRRFRRVFKQIGRNEAIDLEVYALAGLYSLGDVFLKSLKDKADALAVPLEDQPKPEKSTQPQPAVRRRPPRRWVDGWKS